LNSKKRRESFIIFLLIGILIATAIYLNTGTGKAIRSSYLTSDGNLCNNLDPYPKLTAVQQRGLLNYIPKNDPKNLCAKSPSAIKLGGLTGCFADLNNDGVVNSADLPILLGAWGPCDCPDCASQIPISSQNLIKNFLGSKEYSKFVDANPELELNKNIR